MLRSQPDRLILLKSVKGDQKRLQVQLGLQSEMVELGRTLEQFQLDIAAQRGEEMISLRRHGAGGRFRKEAFCLSDL